MRLPPVVGMLQHRVAHLVVHLLLMRDTVGSIPTTGELLLKVEVPLTSYTQMGQKLTSWIGLRRHSGIRPDRWVPLPVREGAPRPPTHGARSVVCGAPEVAHPSPIPWLNRHLLKIDARTPQGQPHRSHTSVSCLMKDWPTYISHLPHPQQCHNSCTVCATRYLPPRGAGRIHQNRQGRQC